MKTVDIITLLIIIVLIALAVFLSIRKKKRGDSCCGGTGSSSCGSCSARGKCGNVCDCSHNEHSSPHK